MRPQASDAGARSRPRPARPWTSTTRSEHPDEELRREHLAERDERHDRRGGVADEAFVARRVPAGEAHPDEQQRRDEGERRRAPAATVATVAGQVLRPGPRRPAERHPEAWWRPSRTPEPRLSICSGRPAWRQTLRATPSGATSANGSRRALPSRASARGAQRRAAPPPLPGPGDEQRQEHGRVDLRRDRERRAGPGRGRSRRRRMARHRGQRHERGEEIEPRQQERPEQRDPAPEGADRAERCARSRRAARRARGRAARGSRRSAKIISAWKAESYPLVRRGDQRRAARTGPAPRRVFDARSRDRAPRRPRSARRSPGRRACRRFRARPRGSRRRADEQRERGGDDREDDGPERHGSVTATGARADERRRLPRLRPGGGGCRGGSSSASRTNGRNHGM